MRTPGPGSASAPWKAPELFEGGKKGRAPGPSCHGLAPARYPPLPRAAPGAGAALPAAEAAESGHDGAAAVAGTAAA